MPRTPSAPLRPRSAAVCGALFLACSAPAGPPVPEASPTPAAAPAPAPPVAAAPIVSVPLTAAERAAVPGRIVYLAEHDAGASIYEILPSGHDPKVILEGTPSADKKPGPPTVLPGPIAPDGATMAVITVEEHDDGAHLERIEVRPFAADGALGEPLWRSDAAPQVRSPNWSPDGRTLAFEAGFSSFRDLYALDLPPGTAPVLRRLTDHPAGNYEPAYAPDGRRIAFVSSRDGNAEVYVMQADGGGDPQRITHFQLDDWGPVWAPDGRTIAFLSNREGSDRIFLCQPDGTELRRLTPAAPFLKDVPGEYEPGEAEPTFTPDGRGIVFSVRTGAQRAALRRADLATGEVTELTSGAASDREPVFAPGGALLVFASDRDGDPELYLMRPDGTGVTRLTERPGPDWLPRWSPR